MILGAISGLLFIWMVLLFCIGPTISYDGSDEGFGQIQGECDSLLGRGWPNLETGYLVDEHGGGLRPDSIEPFPERMPQETQNGIFRDCDGRRAANAGFIGLLAVPTTLFGAAAMVMARRDSTRPGPG